MLALGPSYVVWLYCLLPVLGLAGWGHPSALWTCLTFSACGWATPDAGACSQIWLSNVLSSPDHADSRQTTRCRRALTRILSCILSFKKLALETSEMIWRRAAPNLLCVLSFGPFHHFWQSCLHSVSLMLWPTKSYPAVPGGFVGN